jgi:hypothetical protein
MLVSLSSFLTSYAQFELPQNKAKLGNNRHLRGVEPLFPVFSPGLSTSSVSNCTRKPDVGRPSGTRSRCVWRPPGPMGCRCRYRPVRVPGLAPLIDGGQSRWGVDQVLERVPVFCESMETLGLVDSYCISVDIGQRGRVKRRSPLHGP